MEKPTQVNLNIMLPPITTDHVNQFEATYTHNGVRLVVSDVHKEFARAFAQAVITALLPLVVQQVGAQLGPPSTALVKT